MIKLDLNEKELQVLIDFYKLGNIDKVQAPAYCYLLDKLYRAEVEEQPQTTTLVKKDVE